MEDCQVEAIRCMKSEKCERKGGRRVKEEYKKGKEATKDERNLYELEGTCMKHCDVLKCALKGQFTPKM